MCFDYVFIILVYRNTNDLCELIESIRKHVVNFKIVIVNSYYDDASMFEVKHIASRYDCDFLNVENKGYSYGNNKGIEHAIKHYYFSYIIISNPDIIIKEFRHSILSNAVEIIAPEITTVSGKKQNPMIIAECKAGETLIYQGYKHHLNCLLLGGIGLGKLSNALHNARKRNKSRYPIYCAHGSFVMISREALRLLNDIPYDNNMFLFGEEGVLATKAKKNRIPIFYDSSIAVLHKEDGSMKLSSISVNQELAKANIYYYETYRKGTARE